MTQAELQKLETEWCAVVAGYEKDGNLEPLQQLKREHSIRVSADTRLLAEELEWPEGEVCLAEAVGLLHDTGRFPQYKKYRSFDDSQTVDHGDCGADALADIGVLGELAAEERDQILHAVRFHNKKHLPAELTEREEKQLRLIRDADRLDIFFVTYHAIKTGRVHDYPEVTINVDFDGPPTPQVLGQLERREPIDYRHLHSMADRFLLFLSWMYDLSFPPARRKIHDRQVIDRFLEIAPYKNDRMLRLFDEAATFFAKA